MSQAVTLRQNQPLAQAEWTVLREQAGFLVKSGFLPSGIRTAEQAVAIMLLGRELDVPPWGALSTINVIQGKPTVSPQLMLGLIERSRQAEQIDIKGDDTACTVTMKRRGRTAHTTTFTLDDAKRLGLAGKDNYLKQPGVMLQWRAVAACARVCFPDVILGLYTPDEMGADVVFTDSGEMVVAPESASAPPAATAARDWEPDADTGEIPFDEDKPEPTPIDPTLLANYNQLIRNALIVNGAASSTGKPEVFDMAKWEITSDLTDDEIHAKGVDLKAELRRIDARKKQAAAV